MNTILMSCKHFLSLVSVVAAYSLGAASCGKAEPILQLYLEGGTYDESTETWTLAPPGSSGGAPFRLWAIGNVAGPGGKGTISDVRLAVAYEIAAGDVQINLTPTTTGGFGGFFDPSSPATPQLIQTVDDGSVPLLGDGSELPTHGVYGDGIVWQEFGLGDFDLVDSPVADFIGDFPSAPSEAGGQINVYEVSVTNSSIHPTTVHFDLYDTVASKNKAKAVFAPFSHDADAEATIVPVPSSWALTLAAAVALASGHVLRRRSGARSPAGQVANGAAAREIASDHDA